MTRTTPLILSAASSSTRLFWGKAACLTWLLASGSGLPASAPFEWQTATPESQGMSGEKLEALRTNLAALRTKAFLVARNDKIVCEWYALDNGPKKLNGTASLAKAIVGGVSLAVAMTDGLVALDDKAAQYIPQWRSDSLKAKITVRQLGSHTSGVEDAEADGLPHDKLPGWKGEFWAKQPTDPFTVARDKAPVTFEPGTKWAYSNPGIGLMTYCTTAALQNAPQKDIRTLLRERVMRSIGASDDEWSVGYGKIYTVDGLPLVGSWGGANYTARTAARVGRLMLREGDWDGQRLLSRASVRQTTADAGTPGNNGMGWWNNDDGRYARVPKDAYWGAGKGHQILLVIPSLNLIAVRNGGDLAETAGIKSRDAVNVYLLQPLVAAVIKPGK